jgi:hypothetical protein
VATEDLPLHRHEDALPRRARLRRSLLQLAVATVLVALLALGAGWIFGRVDEPRAARLVLGDEVIVEEASGDAPGPDPEAPTSGPHRGEPLCGVSEAPLTVEEQVASLASGLVVLQHDPGLAADDRRGLRELAEGHDRVVVAPAPGLGAPVVATAWQHRYEQEEVALDRLETFVTGYRGRSPDPRPCPD